MHQKLITYVWKNKRIPWNPGYSLKELRPSEELFVVFLYDNFVHFLGATSHQHNFVHCNVLALRNEILWISQVIYLAWRVLRLFSQD